MSNIEGFGAMLRSMTYATTLVNSPPSEVTISLAGIPKLAADAAAFFRSTRFRRPRFDDVDYDDESILTTVTTVLHLQAYAKAAYARRKGSVGTSATDDELVRTVTRCFSRGLNSTAAYIDSIGAFEIDGQRIIPALPSHPLAHPPVDDGWVRSAIITPEGVMYVDNREDPIIDPNNVDAVFALPAARRRVITRHTENLRKTMEQYERLLRRVERKVPRAVVEIDLASGKGTAAQIVGSRESDGETYPAWCHRFVSEETMLVGAAFKFGYNNEADEWHREAKTKAQTYWVDSWEFFNNLKCLNIQKYEFRYSDSSDYDYD